MGWGVVKRGGEKKKIEGEGIGLALNKKAPQEKKKDFCRPPQDRVSFAGRSAVEDYRQLWCVEPGSDRHDEGHGTARIPLYRRKRDCSGKVFRNEIHRSLHRESCDGAPIPRACRRSHPKS